MLIELSIRDVVLIDALDLTFDNGLGVLTGETGAGKSILLDALGLALGTRAEARLIRHGKDKATVSARFDCTENHPARTLLSDSDIDIDVSEDLTLRRSLTSDGRSRAYVNDQPVSIGLLRELGLHLVEIQGQFEQLGLLDVSRHGPLVDAYGRLGQLVTETSTAFESWRIAQDALAEARRLADEARKDEEFLRFAVDELTRFDPQPGEDEALSAERTLLQNTEKLAEAIKEAQKHLTGPTGADTGLRKAAKALDNIASKTAGVLDTAIDSIDRASIEITETLSALNDVAHSLSADSSRLDNAEERLFALRDLARKHHVAPDDLPALRDQFARQLDMIDQGEGNLKKLQAEQAAAQSAYREKAQALSDARHKAAGTLDAAVNKELMPLKLEKARFATDITDLPEDDWGPNGFNKIVFTASTNPGAPPGPIQKIASGGEISRFLLALKVVLAESGGSRTLVFDEVDSGVGGATAAAVGSRLGRLARHRQVLVVTHSPQVAALGETHWRVEKSDGKSDVSTTVTALDQGQRLEEIARMISGSKITEEARAAASVLLSETVA
ncbi:MAG: DNA repair protein RecN [Alphaproteobacteria bacterium]